MVSAYNVSTQFDHCVFKSSHSDDGLNVKNASTTLNHCLFEANSADGCDIDFSLARVKNCRFVNNGNDGLDFGSASAEVVNCSFESNGDKGISMGEGSHCLISNCLFDANMQGVAVKDSSRPLIVLSVFKNNRVAVNAYRKKYEFSGGSPRLSHCLFVNNREMLKQDTFSKIINHVSFTGRQKVTLSKKELYRDRWLRQVPELFVDQEMVLGIVK